MARRLVIVLAVALAVASIPGCFNGLTLTMVNTNSPVEEVDVEDADSCLCFDKIALIDVDGMILNARSSTLMGGTSENPVSQFRERLEVAACDKHVKAVVLRLNTPGGGVTASDIMYEDLCRFRRQTGKPVVACMMDVCASGGYYLAMGADVVIAHPTTVTGSIGVIMSLYNASGLMTLVGVHSEPIKSGPNKDIGNPARPMTPEERAILQGMVDGFYAQFVQVVARGRHLPEERVRVLADGRVYTGLDAHNLGLVDQIGYLDDALELARNLAHLKDARVVAYEAGGGYRGSIYAATPILPRDINLHLDIPGINGVMGTGTGAGFLYLWEPGANK
jgi:protease IV